MRRCVFVRVLCLLMLVLLLDACVGNEFKVTGNLKNGTTRNLKFVYFASDRKHGFMVENAVPSVQGRFSLAGATVRPAMVWVIDPAGRVLTSFYVRRGDEITITGDENNPASWIISGNELNDSLTQWRTRNAGIISGAGPEKLNSEVKKYVTAHPDELLSAALLLVHYAAGEDGADFDNLWNMLDEDVRDSDLVHSVIGSEQPETHSLADLSLGKLTLYSITDSVQNIDPLRYRASLIYFWRSDEAYHDRHKDLRRLSEFASGEGRMCFVADVCLDADTLSWKRVSQADSVSAGFRRYWAVGGEQNSSLLPLSLRKMPSVVVADRKGKVRYKGRDVESALKEIGKIK